MKWLETSLGLNKGMEIEYEANSNSNNQVIDPEVLILLCNVYTNLMFKCHRSEETKRTIQELLQAIAFKKDVCTSLWGFFMTYSPFNYETKIIPGQKLPNYRYFLAPLLIFA